MGFFLIPPLFVLLVGLGVTGQLRGTRFAWLPGLVLFAGAVATLATHQPFPEHGGPPVLGGMEYLLAFVLLVPAPICMAVGIARSSLRRTRRHWIPGAALIALGVVAYCLLSRDYRELDYPTPFVASLYELARLSLPVLGFAGVGFGAWLRRRTPASERSPEELLPAARVVDPGTAKD
jgi:hypothetical protein